MFRVGQKVVCISDFAKGRSVCPFVEFPTRGIVYTVRSNVIGRSLSGEKKPGILLHEVSNSIGPHGQEYSFCIKQFRPVVERKTDISIFTKMLTPKTRRVQERA